jgi:hypothetical protein
MMKTSDILLQDIKAILLRLASDQWTIAGPWLYRTLKLLMGLLPIVFSLEQSGKNVNPASLMSLDSLEYWMSDVEETLEFQRSKVLLLELKQFLAILPGYKKDHIGKHGHWTKHEYDCCIMMAGGLHNSVKTSKPRSLGVCDIAPMCDDMPLKESL